MKLWKDDEIELLHAFIEAGYTHKEIAQELGRTMEAVKIKCSKLKLKNKNNKLKTHKQYVAELAESCPTVVALEQYKGANTKILHKCLECGAETMYKPASKLSGMGCHSCRYISLTKTHEQYVLDLAEKCPTMKVLEPYKGYETQILHKCLICGNELLSTPHNRLRGHSCQLCKQGNGNINPNRPGITYLVYFYDIDLYKVGITGKTTKLRNKDQGQKYEIIFERHFELGSDAMDLEQEWLENTNHLQINTGLLKNGNSETFRYNGEI